MLAAATIVFWESPSRKEHSETVSNEYHPQAQCWKWVWLHWESLLPELLLLLRSKKKSAASSANSIDTPKSIHRYQRTDRPTCNCKANDIPCVCVSVCPVSVCVCVFLSVCLSRKCVCVCVSKIRGIIQAYRPMPLVILLCLRGDWWFQCAIWKCAKTIWLPLTKNQALWIQTSVLDLLSVCIFLLYLKNWWINWILENQNHHPKITIFQNIFDFKVHLEKLS